MGLFIVVVVVVVWAVVVVLAIDVVVALAAAPKVSTVAVGVVASPERRANTAAQSKTIVQSF